MSSGPDTREAEASAAKIVEEKAAEAKRLADRLAPLDPAIIIKFVGLLCFLAMIGLVGYYIVRFIIDVQDSDNLIEGLATSIRDAGWSGVLICLGMQFIQIVVAFVPGEIVQAVIGLVYGTVVGGLITLVGALISSIFVFYLVRWLGAPFVQGMLGKQEGRRAAAIQRFLSNHKRLNATVFILFLIPGMPKDVLTYLVPLTPMRPAEFFVLSTIARAPAIFATTFVMEALLNQDYLACAIVAGLFGGLGLIGIMFNMKIMELVDRFMARINPHHDDEG